MSAAVLVAMPAPWIVPDPSPRSAWRRFRVVVTHEIEARDESEARTAVIAAGADSAQAYEVAELEAIDQPRPACGHPEEWTAALNAAVEPDVWQVQSSGEGGWRWLTDGALALRMPLGVAHAGLVHERSLVEPRGAYSEVSPSRSSRVSDAGEPCAQLGTSVIEARYAWLVERLFGPITWMAGGAFDPVRAFASGRLVALVMPLDPRGP